MARGKEQRIHRRLGKNKSWEKTKVGKKQSKKTTKKNGEGMGDR